MKQLEKMKKPEDSCMQAETRDEKELLDNLEYHNNFSQIMLEQMECGVLAYTLPGRKLIQINREALRIYSWKDEKEAAENLAEAAKIMSESPGALHLRTLATINDVSSDQSNTIIFAVPIEVLNAFGKENLVETVNKLKK